MLRLSTTLLLIGLLSVVGVSPYLSDRFSSTRPFVPDPASGRVYVLQVRGARDVYVTQLEHWAVFGSFAGGILLSVLGAVLLQRSIRKDLGAAA